MGEWDTIRVREANTPPEMALQVALRAYEQALRHGADQRVAFDAVITALKGIVPDPYPYAQFADDRYADLQLQVETSPQREDYSIEPWTDVENWSEDATVPLRPPHDYRPRWGFFHEGAIITAADVAELADKKRQQILESSKKLKHEGEVAPNSESTADAEMLRLLQKYNPDALPDATEPGATLDPDAATWRPSHYIIQDAFHRALRYAPQDSPFYEEWNKFVLRGEQFNADRQKYNHLARVLIDLPDEAFKLFDFVARQIKRDAWPYDADDEEKMGVIRDSAAVLNELARKNKPWPQLNSKEFTFQNLEDWLNEPEHLQILKGVSADDFLPGPGYDPDTDQVVHEFPDGWTIRELPGGYQGQNDLETEGTSMDNCIKDYDQYSWDDKIDQGYSRMFSLRDPRNYPHVSMEFVGDGPPVQINQMYGKGNNAPIPKYQEYIDKWFDELERKHGQHPYRGSHDYEFGDEEEEEHEPEHLEDYDEDVENSEGEFDISNAGELEDYYDQLLHHPRQFYMSDSEPFDVNDDGDFAYRREYGRKVDAWHLEGAVEDVLTQLAQEPHVNETQMQWGYDLMEAAVLASSHSDRSENTTTDLDSYLSELADQIKSSVRPNSPHPDQLEFEPPKMDRVIDTPAAYGILPGQGGDDPGLNPWGEERDQAVLDDVTAEGAKMALAAIDYYHEIKGISIPVPYWDEEYPGRTDFKAYFKGAAKPLPGMKGTDEKPHSPDQTGADDTGWAHPLPNPDIAYREWVHERNLREQLGPSLKDFGKDGLPELQQGQHAVLADGKHVWLDKPLDDNSGWLAFDQQRRPVRVRDRDRLKLLEGDIQPSAVRDFDDEGHPYIVGVTTHPNARRHSIGWTPSGHVHVVGPGESDWAPVYTSQHDPPLWPRVREDMDRSGYIPQTMNQQTGEWEQTPLDHLSQQNAEYTLTGQPNIVGTMPHPGGFDDTTIGWTPSGRIFNVTDPDERGAVPAAWAPPGQFAAPDWLGAVRREMERQGFPGEPHTEHDERWPYGRPREASTKTAGQVGIRDVSDQPDAEFYLVVGANREEPQTYTVGQYQHMKFALGHEDDWKEERPDSVHIFNAYDGSKLIGSLVFEMYNRPSYETGLESYSGPFMREEEYGDHGFLMSVYVDPMYRGTGIYQQFMAILDQYDVPVYGSFSNDNLRQHMYDQYDPSPDARTSNFVVYSKDIREMAQTMYDRLIARPDIQKLREQNEALPSYAGDLTPDQLMIRRRAGILVRALSDLLRRYPESFKLWPWAVTEITKHMNVADVAGYQGTSHFVDIVGQAGSTISDLRKHNRLPTGFDVNQMRFDELEDWLYSNREHEDNWQSRTAVYTFKNGWTMEKIESESDLNLEGDEMGHCVGGYWDMVADGRSEIYSLRDPKGGPHATVELSKPLPAYTDEGNDVGEGQVVRQVQGKQDTRPVEKYEQMLKEWFNHLNEGGNKLYWSGEMGENLGGYGYDENDISNINDLEIWWEKVKANPAKLATGGGIQVSTKAGDYGLPQAYESSNKPYVRDWEKVLKDAAYILSDNYEYGGRYDEPSWGRNWRPDPGDIGQAIYYLAWVDGQDLGSIVEDLDETIMDTQHRHEDNGYEWYRDQAQEVLNQRYGEDELDDNGEPTGQGVNHEDHTINGGDEDNYEEEMAEARQNILDEEFKQPYELSQYLYHLNDLHPGHRSEQHPSFQPGQHQRMVPAEGSPPESLPSLWGAKTEFERLQESLAEDRQKATNPHGPAAEQAMPGNDEHTSAAQDYNERGERCPMCKSPALEYQQDHLWCTKCGWGSDHPGLGRYTPTEPPRTSSLLDQGLYDLCHPLAARSGLWAFQAASEGTWALSHPEHEPQTISTRDLALRGIVIRVTDDGHALVSL